MHDYEKVQNVTSLGWIKRHHHRFKINKKAGVVHAWNPST
jgi:hypothetical protein